jgi:hypothetical protein
MEENQTAQIFSWLEISRKIMALVTILANSLVIISTMKTKNFLQNNANKFMVLILCVDLFTGVCFLSSYVDVRDQQSLLSCLLGFHVC